MKKVIGLAMGCLLGGCVAQQEECIIKIEKERKVTIAERYFRQDTAALPQVHVIPSERAIAFKAVDFDELARRIRNLMVMQASYEKFKKVRLVLLDYTVLPVTEKDDEGTGKKHFHHRKVFHKKFITKPERYVMNISFYEGNKRPPAAPLFQGTVFMDTGKAFPHEAMSFMVDELIDEYVFSNLKKVEVNLD